jgi:hypothetical protein
MWKIIAIAVGLVVITIVGLVTITLRNEDEQESGRGQVVADLGSIEVTRLDLDEYLANGVPKNSVEKYARDYTVQGLNVKVTEQLYTDLLESEGLRITREDIDNKKKEIQEQMCGSTVGCPKEYVWGWELTARLMAKDAVWQKHNKGWGYKPTQRELREWYQSKPHLQEMGPFESDVVRKQTEYDLVGFNGGQLQKILTAKRLEIIKKASFEEDYEWIRQTLLDNGGMAPPAGG